MSDDEEDGDDDEDKLEEEQQQDQSLNQVSKNMRQVCLVRK